jgi:hypothetical protein
MRTDGQDGNLEHWRDLYTAALVELSSDKLPQRIQDAQRAIVDGNRRRRRVSNGAPGARGRFVGVTRS